MPVKVVAVFDKGRIKPVLFFYENRKYYIKCINYEWVSTNGISKIYHFAVSDGENNFELTFDDKKMIWNIKTEQYFI